MAGGRHVPPLTPDQRLRQVVRMSVDGPSGQVVGKTSSRVLLHQEDEMPKPKIVTVPDIPGPTRPLCYKQGRLLQHCMRVQGHEWLHDWEAYERIQELERQIAVLTRKET